MKILNRQDIFSDKNRKMKEKKVHIPEWGGAVIVREMTAKQRDMIDQMSAEIGGPYVDLRARVAVASAFGEDGTPLFKPEDVHELSGMSGNALNAIMEASSELSAMGRDSVETSEKN